MAATESRDRETAGEITRLLRRMGTGDQGAESRLFDLVYRDLHGAARRLMRRQSPAHTLQTTALVHEAYLRVASGRSMRWNDRGHFLATAARAMRCILVDHARRRKRGKRGAGAGRVPLDDVLDLFAAKPPDLIDLDAALTELSAIDVRAARVVELRFFGQVPVADVARILGVERRSVERDWSWARAWLYRRMS